MPATPHIEKHFTGSQAVRDVVIGMSDGLTVPFALAAGISGAVSSTDIVVTAGLAEIAAGAIAMGLGGYLAARTDIEHYATERSREMQETAVLADRERQETADIVKGFGLTGADLERVVASISADKERWVEFMMRFELGLERPDAHRAPISALTIGGSYLIGGFIPLISYIVMGDIMTALRASIAITLVALAIFGAVKGKLTGVPASKAAGQTVLVGGIAATVAFAIARAIG